GYWLVHDYSDNLIYVIDISNPDAPVKFSQWSVPNMVNGGTGNMMIEGTLMYLPCGENFTLRIYDLSDLTAVTQVGSVSTAPEQHFGNPVKIGSYVYIGTSIWLGASFLRVIDVSNPASPTVVGSLAPTGAVMGMNGKLFAFGPGPTVHAFSLADPLVPVVEASSTVPVPAPSTSLDLLFVAWHSGWVGNYLIGLTHGSASEYHGIRAMDFTVN
ncbi:MAG: hypothetical protein JRG91_13635, partial [Deltaproteobacteria bacterium]|nr:hypothetical protein [Deltaproteobacteria bacterium]